MLFSYLCSFLKLKVYISLFHPNFKLHFIFHFIFHFIQSTGCRKLFRLVITNYSSNTLNFSIPAIIILNLLWIIPYLLNFELFSSHYKLVCYSYDSEELLEISKEA